MAACGAAELSAGPFRAFLDERCLVSEPCLVDVAESFLAPYAADFTVPNQAIAALSCTALVFLNLVGPVPRPAALSGKALLLAWLAVQVAAVLCYALSVALAVAAYANAAWKLSPCLARVGSAPLIHLAAGPTLAAQPAVARNLLAMCMALLSMNRGLQTCTEALFDGHADRFQASVAIAAMCFQLLFVWVFPVLAEACIVYWIGTLSYLFSIVLLPVPVAVLLCTILVPIAARRASKRAGDGAALTSWVSGTDWVATVMKAMLAWVALSPWVALSTVLAFHCYKGAGHASNVSALKSIYLHAFTLSGARFADVLDVAELFSGGFLDGWSYISNLGGFLDFEPGHFLQGSRAMSTAGLACCLLKALLLGANQAALRLSQGRCGAPAEEALAAADEKAKACC